SGHRLRHAIACRLVVPPATGGTTQSEGGTMTTLSYEHGVCDEPLIGETIGHNLERTVARVPDGDALVSCHQGVRYSYAEFNEAVDRLASSMLAAGLHTGDRVGGWGAT